MTPLTLVSLTIVGGAAIVSAALAFQRYPTVAAWLFLAAAFMAMCLVTS